MTTEERIAKLEQGVKAVNERFAKMNSCHSPSSGQFCSGGSGGGMGGGSGSGIKLKMASSSGAAPMSAKGTQTVNVIAGRGGDWTATHNDSGVRAVRSSGSTVVEVKVSPNGNFRASQHMRNGGTNWVRGAGPDKLGAALTKFGV